MGEREVDQRAATAVAGDGDAVHVDVLLLAEVVRGVGNEAHDLVVGGVLVGGLPVDEAADVTLVAPALGGAAGAGGGAVDPVQHDDRRVAARRGRPADVRLQRHAAALDLDRLAAENTPTHASSSSGPS